MGDRASPHAKRTLRASSSTAERHLQRRDDQGPGPSPPGIAFTRVTGAPLFVPSMRVLAAMVVRFADVDEGRAGAAKRDERLALGEPALNVAPAPPALPGTA